MKTSEEYMSPVELVSSLEQVYKLKSIPRTGWVQSGISAEEVESIASHSFGMAMLILFLTPQLESDGVDVDRVLSMALIHDIAESITGDITPQDGVSMEAKYEAESKAFDQIIRNSRGGDKFRALWDEFESGESAEAQVVRRMDKLDMLMQAYLYEKKYSIRLNSFWEDMGKIFIASESEEIYNYIRSNRYQTKG